MVSLPTNSSNLFIVSSLTNSVVTSALGSSVIFTFSKGIPYFSAYISSLVGALGSTFSTFGLTSTVEIIGFTSGISGLITGLISGLISGIFTSGTLGNSAFPSIINFAGETFPPLSMTVFETDFTLNKPFILAQ